MITDIKEVGSKLGDPQDTVREAISEQVRINAGDTAPDGNLVIP